MPPPRFPPPLFPLFSRACCSFSCGSSLCSWFSVQSPKMLFRGFACGFFSAAGGGALSAGIVPGFGSIGPGGACAEHMLTYARHIPLTISIPFIFFILPSSHFEALPPGHKPPLKFPTQLAKGSYVHHSLGFPQTPKGCSLAFPFTFQSARELAPASWL